ncbi:MULTISPECIES: heavy metal response regulator transcription factor [Pseudomonas]|jgi:two-component system copper resistance phosphate regulon response regulator CusR|uniref:Heavy metal response regulator transcription factor n=3 Tax=Pseudomonas TaxID=286 RepID=A0AB36CVX1_9PSED|nr:MULTISPECIES: heavy metal response regulator transcription factor [Pseudomonas]AVX93329.1 DNA-binding response regulator [Pseudomonas koreensis]KAE9645870.1 response regulator [Pseudomonas sp. PB103]MBC2691918.1 heavy metal response regulator transcription factor [Pseudomonas kielensis]MBI6945462.1 heavy metal response regulator transcription factor [Pseudomonas koreensis]MBK3468840.1 heavy metal response regulator transcription factor [Pseudomonas sp. MF6776]
MRILIIEDDPKTAHYLRQGLTESGFIVDCIQNGIDGINLVSQQAYDLVVLDVNPPQSDDWDLLVSIREVIITPIMMLTEKGSVEDKVLGFDLGADDYMVKPIEFPELLARVRTLMRRTGSSASLNVLRVGDLELDLGRHRTFRANQRIDLTNKEFALLHFLMCQSGTTLSRTQIKSSVWGLSSDCDTNVVQVAMRRLRAKIDDPFDDKLIHTLRGAGYVLESRAH